MIQTLDEPLNNDALKINEERATWSPTNRVSAYFPDNETAKLRTEADHLDIHAPFEAITNTNENFKSSSDKRIENKNKAWTNWMKVIHKVDGYACFSNMIFNVLGAFTMLSSIPQSLKKNIERFVGLITTLSYVPYGISGMNQGLDKKNPFQAIGFLGESILPWFGNLKNIYLIRGLSAGIDQMWDFTDRNVPEKYAKGFFPNFSTGFKESSKACFKLLKEIGQDPMKTLIPVKFDKVTNSWKFESKGHNGLLSTIFDVIASVGYMLTGKEKVFGPMRDLASWLFDVELTFQDKLQKKASGLLFILEGALDFVARYLNKNEDMRLFVNMLAHASGRGALMLYKNSCASAQKIAAPDKQIIVKQEPRVQDKQINESSLKFPV